MLSVLTIAMSILGGYIIDGSSLLFVVAGLIVVRDKYGWTAVTGSATELFDKLMGWTFRTSLKQRNMFLLILNL